MFTKVPIFLTLISTSLCSLQLCADNVEEKTNLNTKERTFHKQNKICVRKCCDFGQTYDSTQRKCTNNSDEFNPDIWNNYKPDEKLNALNLFSFVIGKPKCLEEEALVKLTDAYNNGFINMDGNIYINNTNRVPPWIIMKPNKYCIDKFVYNDSKSNLVRRHDMIVCYLPPPEPNYILSSSCMLISCVFILATVGVYASLPDLRDKLHSRVLMAYLLSFFFGFFLLGLMQILIIVDLIAINTCICLAFFIYFFLLSAFFWLNVMSFDIWRSLTSNSKHLLTKRGMEARLYKYATYAFGIPAVLTILMLSLELSGLPSYWFMPLLRLHGGFLYGNSRLLYLYGPIVILCVENLTFFILTAWKIIDHKRKTASVLSGAESSRNDQQNSAKESFLICIKLFVVMGINWLLEVVSSLYPEYQETVWNYTDAYNLLVGLIIFIIFVCKKEIFKKLKKRYQELRSNNLRCESKTSVNTTRTNISNQGDLKMDKMNMATVSADGDGSGSKSGDD